MFRGLNVERNIMAALEVVEPDPDRRDLMLDELLAEFGISHLRRTSALALSGGERRRVEIARALATQPNYILLDEPLAGIDPIAVGEIRDLDLAPEGPRHRRADHRPQRPRDAGDRRPRLHHARRPGADGGPAARGRRASKTCAASILEKGLACKLCGHGDGSTLRVPADAVAGHDAAAASGDQAAAVHQPRSRRIRRGGTRAQPAARARRAVGRGARAARPRPARRGRRPTSTRPRCCAMEKLPDAVEADHSNSFDEGGASDGYRPPGRARRARHAGRARHRRPGRAPRNLRAHLGEQLRLELPRPEGPDHRRAPDRAARPGRPGRGQQRRPRPGARRRGGAGGRRSAGR